MKIPNATRAEIAEEKLREYLLNVEHHHGASKARLLLSLGYRPESWRELETDIRLQHLTVDVDVTKESEYGTRYEIVGPLVGPLGQSVDFRSVWQIDIGTDHPRLITMYPE